MAAINNTDLANCPTVLPTLQPNLASDSALNLLTRTVVGGDHPLARGRAILLSKCSARSRKLVGAPAGPWAEGDRAVPERLTATRAHGLSIPATRASSGAWTTASCPRVDTTAGIDPPACQRGLVIYHSMQVKPAVRRRPERWCALHLERVYRLTTSGIFNPSVRGEVAVSPELLRPALSDRSPLHYDRPHRLSANFVWGCRSTAANGGLLVGRVVGGWLGGRAALQSGSPFAALNGLTSCRSAGSTAS